jgi:hypothetical protein
MPAPLQKPVGVRQRGSRRPECRRPTEEPHDRFVPASAPPTRLIETEEDVTPFVPCMLARTPDMRLRAVLMAASRHLHAFVREARPTEPDFELAIRWLRDVGQACTDSHNEMVLPAERWAPRRWWT